MEGRGVAMAEDRTPAAGQDCGHPAPAGREARVADGVHATVDPMQPSLVKAVLDPGPRMPKPQQLRARHDAVLRHRKRGKTCVI